jgi:adenylate kinase
MKKPIICVTGTPGCGKTTYAKKLSKEKKLPYVNVTGLLKKKKMHERYDRSLQTYVFDVKKVVKLCVDLIKVAQKKGEGLVLDGHLSHYVPSIYIDSVIVVKCDLKTLKKRLEQRKYSQKKIRENLDAEILDVCLIEAKELGHIVKVVRT